MVGCLGRSLNEAKAMRSLSLGVSAGCEMPRGTKDIKPNNCHSRSMERKMAVGTWSLRKEAIQIFPMQTPYKFHRIFLEDDANAILPYTNAEAVFMTRQLFELR